MLLRYLRYAARWHRWPSRLQRLHMQGDPTGEVQATADRILAEIRADSRIARLTQNDRNC